MSLACSRGVIIAEYPVAMPPAAQEGRTSGREETTGRYWSAYVRIENQDVPFLWKTSKLDYALITVNASIPTRQGKPVVRTLPLFTLERGAIRTETGLDLLRKLPLTRESRETVSFELQITYLKNKRALEVARTILDKVGKLAEPFLASYPMASQIIESSVELIDGVTDTEKSAPVSSTKWNVDLDDLFERSEDSEDGSTMQVFFLIPTQMGVNRGQGKNDGEPLVCPPESDTTTPNVSKTVEACGVKVWLRDRIGEGRSFVPCADMPGRLCVVDDKAEPAVDAQEAVRRINTRITTLVEPPALGDMLKSVDSLLLFVQQDSRSGDDSPLAAADLPDSVKAKLEAVLVDARALEVEQSAACAGEGARSQACLEASRDLAVRKERVAAAARYAVEETNELKTSQAASDALREMSTDATYLDGRLDSVVYITIEFKPYVEVYDPLVFLSDAGNGCANLGAESIDALQGYFNSNVDFFNDQDGDSIRMMIHLARQLVEVRELLERKSEGEAIRVMLDVETTRRAARRAPYNQIGNRLFQLEGCFGEIDRRMPIRQFRDFAGLDDPNAWQELSDPSVLGNSKCFVPTAYSDDVRRFDLFDVALQEILASAGKVPDYGQPTLDSTVTHEQAFVEILFSEAKRIRRAQLDVAEQSSCPAPGSGWSPLYDFSDACEECFAALKATCAKAKTANDNAALTELEAGIRRYRAQRRACTEFDRGRLERQ